MQQVVEELDGNPGFPFPGVLPALLSCPVGPPQAPREQTQGKPLAVSSHLL